MERRSPGKDQQGAVLSHFSRARQIKFETISFLCSTHVAQRMWYHRRKIPSPTPEAVLVNETEQSSFFLVPSSSCEGMNRPRTSFRHHIEAGVCSRFVLFRRMCAIFAVIYEGQSTKAFK